MYGFIKPKPVHLDMEHVMRNTLPSLLQVAFRPTLQQNLQLPRRVLLGPPSLVIPALADIPFLRGGGGMPPTSHSYVIRRVWGVSSYYMRRPIKKESSAFLCVIHMKEIDGMNNVMSLQKSLLCPLLPRCTCRVQSALGHVGEGD